MNKEEKLEELLNKVKETPDNIIEEAIDKTSIDLAKEDLFFMNEGDYVTKEMEHSARVLEKYTEQLESNIEASEKEHKHDLKMIDEVKGDAVKLYRKIDKLKEEIEEKDKKIEKALDLIFQYGQIDEAHHKAWVIDQTVRILIKDKYDEWIKNYVYDEETGDTYSWDKGIAP